MVTIIICLVIGWGVKEAAEDLMRTWRGDPPPEQRRGLRGAIERGWDAVADRHQRALDSGHISAYGYWKHKWHLAREKALAKAGFKTEEEIARGAAEHRHRLGLIAKGIDPDTMPPLFPPRGKDGRPVPWEPPVEEPLAEPPSVLPDPEPAEPVATVDDHYDSNADLLDDTETTVPDTIPDPWDQAHPWSPYAPTVNTDTKENTMSSTGEITGPAGVLTFHNEFKTVMDSTTALADTLSARATEFEKQAGEVRDNITATETAAAGMSRLGMTDGAAAAEKLMEIQSAIAGTLAKLAEAHNTASAALADLAAAAEAPLDAILAAYNAQMTVKDTRDGVGRGNLATDTYLDNAQ